MPTINIDTDILIRTPIHDDASALFQLIDDNRQHLGRWMPWVPGTTSIADIEEFIRRAWGSDNSANMIGGLIEYGGKLSGLVSLRGLNSLDKHADFGYYLSSEFEGNGITTRCCRRLIDIAFTEHDVHRITIRAARDNARSRAIPERLGFTLEGYQREAAFLEGQFHDLAFYSMLAHEWNPR